MKNLVNAFICSIIMLGCIAIELYPSGKIMVKAVFCKVNVTALLDSTPKLKKYTSLITEEEINNVLNATIGSNCINTLK